MAENWRKTNVLHLHFRSIFHPDQRYIGSTSDLKSRLAIRRFFLRKQKEERSNCEGCPP